MKSVVITGMGAVTPLGVGATTLHERWLDGISGLAGGVGECNEFDPTDWLTRREIRRTPRFAQLALAAAQEALDEAAWGDGAPYSPDRVGCIIGTGYGAATSVEALSHGIRERGADGISPLQVATATANSAAVALQLRHELKGESFGLVAACAAGAEAIGAGLRIITSGAADAMVVGGAESGLSETIRTSLDVVGATSTTGISRPFDSRRDGFVLSEGAGVLVLEDMAKATARQAIARGHIIGYGASSDAFHVTAPPPNGVGSAAAMRSALADAGLAPTDVQYVNAHGTSTVLNDRSETIALKSVFGDHAYDLQVSSTKSAIGHLIGGAGAVEAIATMYALNTGTVGPTIGLEQPEEGLDLNYVPLRPQPLRPPDSGDPVAISNCFGFGGHNAVIVLRSSAADGAPGDA